MKEAEIIKMLMTRAYSGCHPISSQIGDDAALIGIEGGQLLATCDALVENVHFKLNWISPRQLGFKSVAVNVSDIGAMGGLPTAVLITLALPERLNQTLFVTELFDGIEEACRQWSVEIIGGDTVRSPVSLMVNISCLGTPSLKGPVSRTAIRQGDAIYVTGTVGDAHIGWMMLEEAGAARQGTAAGPIRRQLLPTPPVSFAHSLAENQLVSAMTDLSDGIFVDLPRMLEATNLGARIDVRHLPLSPDVIEFCGERRIDPYSVAYYGGEDYELLICAAPEQHDAIQRLADRHKLFITRIGSIRKDPGVDCAIQLTPGTQAVKPFHHFGS